MNLSLQSTGSKVNGLEQLIQSWRVYCHLFNFPDGLGGGRKKGRVWSGLQVVLLTEEGWSVLFEETEELIELEPSIDIIFVVVFSQNWGFLQVSGGMVVYRRSRLLFEDWTKNGHLKFLFSELTCQVEVDFPHKYVSHNFHKNNGPLGHLNHPLRKFLIHLLISK